MSTSLLAPARKIWSGKHRNEPRWKEALLSDRAVRRRPRSAIIVWGLELYEVSFVLFSNGEFTWQVVLAEAPRGYDTTDPVALGRGETYERAFADARAELAALVVACALARRAGSDSEQTVGELFIQKQLEHQQIRRAVMDGVANELREKDAASLTDTDRRFLEQHSLVAEPLTPATELSQVWLTGILEGSRKRPQVWLEDTYRLDVPDALLRQLAPSAEERERVFRALDAHLPVCCMAAVDRTGSTLFELDNLFFPSVTVDHLEDPPPQSAESPAAIAAEPARSSRRAAR